MKPLMALLLVMSCATSPGVGAGQPFSLAPGKSVTVDGVKVTLEGVGQDSRCPPDVQCIWAGDAEVRVRVGDQAVTLHTHGGPQYPNAATMGSRTIKLQDLSRSPYTATFVVTVR